MVANGGNAMMKKCANCAVSRNFDKSFKHSLCDSSGKRDNHVTVQDVHFNVEVAKSERYVHQF